MSLVKSIVLLLTVLGLWLNPASTLAGGCCGAVEKTMPVPAGCVAKCGCCCTDTDDSCSLPDAASAETETGSCCAGEAPVSSGDGCGGNCTCLGSTGKPVAPQNPVTVPQQGQPQRPDMVASILLPTEDMAANLVAVSQRQHRDACWSGPAIYLVNDVFRI